MEAPHLLSRTTLAAQIYYGPDRVDEIHTVEECQRICQEIGIDPEELCSDDSKVWHTLQLLSSIREGQAVLSFRGAASQDIVERAVQASSYLCSDNSRA